MISKLSFERTIQRMSRDAKHSVKDCDKPFTCPYGSCGRKFGKPGQTNFGAHHFCQAYGKLLPAHLDIDLGAVPPRLGLLRLDDPTFKDLRFDDPTYEGWINAQHVLLPTKAPSKAKKGKEVKYKQLVYWFEELAVRVNGQVQRFPNWEALVEYFLTGSDLKVLHRHAAEWLPTLTTHLIQRDVTPKRFHVGYQVPGRFSCYNIYNYAIEELEDFEACNHFIFELTGMNLTDKLTAAQLGYEYWWETEGKHQDIRVLQGDERKTAAASYYGARVFANTCELRSSEADEIESGTYSYEELLDEGLVEDVWIQGDVTSKYPYLMSSVSQSYYPRGVQRRSNEGAQEFANGTVGLYEVDYTRPPGLKLAILPVKIQKRLIWNKEPGTGSGWYTEVDLMLAKEYGYRLKFRGPCLCWDAKGHPYDQYVKTLFEARQTEKDEAVLALIKHLLVTLYGKMAQKESGTIADLRRITEEEMLDLLDAGRGLEIVIDEDGTYYVREGQQTAKVPTKPNHLGCWILSWSRKFMAEMFKVVDYNVLATRTDSLLVAYPDYVKLRDAGYVGTGLGKLKVEHGVIYHTVQHHATKYTHHFLNKEGDCDTVVKGERKNGAEVAQVSLEEEDDE